MKASLLTEPGFGWLWPLAALSCLTVSSQAQQPQGYSYPPPRGYSQPASPQQYSAPQYPQQSGYPQQGYNYPQGGYSQPQQQSQYVSPIEFLPTFGRKFGDMFRKVFYGEGQQAPSYQTVPQGYAQPGYGRNLDSAPPSYQSQYREEPRGYQQPQPRYEQSPQQRAQPNSVPQYQTPPPPQRQAVESMPPSTQGRAGNSSPPPRMSLKSPQTPKTPQTPPKSSPPKKYVPPTLSKKEKPVVEEMPPPPMEKKETASSSSEYYPLPGAKPKTQASKDTAPSKPKTNTSSSTAGNSGAFLKGKKAGKEGRVISPYPPYQELDITGLSSGSLALDPTTQKVFEVP